MNEVTWNGFFNEMQEIDKEAALKETLLPLLAALTMKNASGRVHTSKAVAAKLLKKPAAITQTIPKAVRAKIVPPGPLRRL